MRKLLYAADLDERTRQTVRSTSRQLMLGGLQLDLVMAVLRRITLEYSMSADGRCPALVFLQAGLYNARVGSVGQKAMCVEHFLAKQVVTP